MKKQNKIKISKKLIVNIKYDLVQCKQINIACRIHLLNRKKKDSFSTFATTIFNLQDPSTIQNFNAHQELSFFDD